MKTCENDTVLNRLRQLAEKEEERYRLSFFEAEMDVSELLNNYQDKERFLAFCRECENYGKLWSCPPYDFGVAEYLKAYKKVHLIGTKIYFCDSLREESMKESSMPQVPEEILARTKAEVDEVLLQMEREEEGVKMLSSGGCRLCGSCMRGSGQPCCKKESMRYSLESLGCDVVRLSKDKLGLELQWMQGKLPEYFVLVNGLLRK